MTNGQSSRLQRMCIKEKRGKSLFFCRGDPTINICYNIEYQYIIYYYIMVVNLILLLVLYFTNLIFNLL